MAATALAGGVLGFCLATWGAHTQEVGHSVNAPRMSDGTRSSIKSVYEMSNRLRDWLDYNRSMMRGLHRMSDVLYLEIAGTARIKKLSESEPLECSRALNASTESLRRAAKDLWSVAEVSVVENRAPGRLVMVSKGFAEAFDSWALRVPKAMNYPRAEDLCDDIERAARRVEEAASAILEGAAELDERNFVEEDWKGAHAKWREALQNLERSGEALGEACRESLDRDMTALIGGPG
jgi:hypothetical protein